MVCTRKTGIITSLLDSTFAFYFVCRVRLIPNTYEMVYTYSKEYDNESSMRPWPDWIQTTTNIREAAGAAPLV